MVFLFVSFSFARDDLLRRMLLSVFFLFRQLEGALVRPDGVDAHAAPTFLVDVVESDGLAVVERLLLRCTLTFRFIVSRHDIRAGSATRFTVFTVFLDKFEDDDALVQGFFLFRNVHDSFGVFRVLISESICSSSSGRKRMERSCSLERRL